MLNIEEHGTVILQVKLEGFFFLHERTIGKFLPKMWFYGCKLEPNRREFKLSDACLPSVFSQAGNEAVLSSHKHTEVFITLTNAPHPASSLLYLLGRAGTQT